MDPLVGAGLVSAAGGVLQNLLGISSAGKQMKFQERMRNTAYQAAVKDMRLAGINPMLAYMQGGAQSPGGAMYQPADMVGPAVSSAMQAKRLQSELALMDSDRRSRQLANLATEYRMGWKQDGTFFEDNQLDAERRRAVAEAEGAEYRNAELRAIAGAWSKIGEKGKWAQLAFPFIRLLLGR